MCLDRLVSNPKAGSWLPYLPRTVPWEQRAVKAPVGHVISWRVLVEVRVMRRLIALGVFALGGVSVAADTPAELITKPGEQTLFDGKLNVHVADDGKTTKFEVTFAGPAGGVAHKFEAKSADTKGWFVVAESAGRVWLYRGGDALFVMDYADNPPGAPAGSKSS